ncbi:MAG: phospholipid carrier-dependent glycosyltransferase, partial [Acidobacteriota bacterium]
CAGTAVATRAVTLGLRAALGLAVAGQLFVLLGLAGALRPWSIGTLTVLVIAGGVYRWNRQERTRYQRGMVAGAIVSASPLFALALYPPTSFDETLYHLPFVRALARSGAIGFQPDLRFPIFPQLHEALCAPAFLALGDVATHLVALGELLILVALLIDWPRDRRAGILAAALALGNPIVVHLGTITYVDSALTLFVAAGFYCLDRGCRAEGPAHSWRRRSRPLQAGEEHSPADNSGWYFAAAGLLLGSACSVKYLGWYFAGAATLFVILFAANRRRAIPLFLVSLGAGVVPTYARIYTLTGNPLFPFLTGVFGSSQWRLDVTAKASLSTRILWDITFGREHLNQQPPYSPLFALGIILLLGVMFRSRRVAFLVALSGGYLAIFTLLPQDSRYLLPLLPLVSIATASAIASWLASRGSGGVSIVVLSLLSIAPGLAYAGYRLVRQGPPPLTAKARHIYLERHIPEYRALERRGPGRIYVCGAEQLKYFGGNDMIGDVSGPFANEKLFGENRSAAALSPALARLGVRYLLLSRRAGRPEWRRVPAPPQFERVYADDGAELWRLCGPLTVDSR